ncbi:hypothetical protein Tco_0746606 [Tanacetum coccineum]
MDEVCSICCAGNSFVNDPNPNSFNDSPNFFNHPSQPQMYSCELCGNDAHYGYDCPPQVSLIYEPEPCYKQNFDNNFPQTSPSFPQQYLCCIRCGGPHETFQCQQLIFYEPEPCYNQNFDDTPSRRFNYTYYDDDDDEESTIPWNEIISQLPQSIAITPVLPTMEPEDSLIMEDEHLHTIPEKESDEFIKSSV